MGKKEQKERRQKFEEYNKKQEELVKQLPLKYKEEQSKEFEKKKEIIKGNFEKFHEKMKKKHQDAHQLIELYKYTKSNETNGEYIFQIRENEFKKKLEEEEEEKRNKMIEELRKKKSIYKPIQREELDEFKRKHEEVRQELLLKKYQERVNHFQEHEQKNLNSQIPETESYKKILVEEKTE